MAAVSSSEASFIDLVRGAVREAPWSSTMREDCASEAGLVNYLPVRAGSRLLRENPGHEAIVI